MTFCCYCGDRRGAVLMMIQLNKDLLSRILMGKPTSRDTSVHSIFRRLILDTRLMWRESALCD